MTHPFSEDRPEPVEQPIRARVPDHIAGGAFSTGVIVMTAQTELILDFVQNLGRPHQIVARVIMPHHVLPQFVDALRRNVELYRGRWGELPNTGMPAPVQLPWAAPDGTTPAASGLGTESVNTLDVGAGMPTAGQSPGSSDGGNAAPAPPDSGPGTSDPSGSGQPSQPGAESPPPPTASGPNEPGRSRQTSAQDVYDDLKIRDELLSGAYANAVMIGHGPHEFSFDFITNFYPNSCVSSRVFLAAGQIPRLLDSLQGTWQQLRQRRQLPPGGQSPAGGASPEGGPA